MGMKFSYLMASLLDALMPLCAYNVLREITTTITDLPELKTFLVSRMLSNVIVKKVDLETFMNSHVF